jgi:isoprenylcysteine carboxyl methyltransferase (ICMT) family protein YpbQ
MIITLFTNAILISMIAQPASVPLLAVKLEERNSVVEKVS